MHGEPLDYVKNKVRRIPRWLPYVVIALFVGWCCYRLRGDLLQLSLGQVLKSWDLVALAALLSLLNYAVRVVRWRSYLGRLGHRFSLRFTALTFVAGFAYTLSPGKVGEMARARYYLPLGVPLTDVAAAFFAERLMDLIAMLVLSALLVEATTRFQGPMVLAAVLIVTILAALTLIPWERAAARLKSSARLPRLARAVTVPILDALVSTRPLLKPVPLLLGFVLALLAWGFEGVGFGVLCSLDPGTAITMGAAAGIYAIAVLIGGLSLLPGGLGSTEAVMTALLVSRSMTLPQAILVTLSCRLVTLWLAVLLGWIAVLILRQRRLVGELRWQ
jgi:glycosyltransferase 2 family protein